MSLFDLREWFERLIPAWLPFAIVGGLLLLAAIQNIAAKVRRRRNC